MEGMALMLRRWMGLFLFLWTPGLLAAGVGTAVPWETGLMQADPAQVLKAANAIQAEAGEHVKGLYRLKKYEFDKEGRLTWTSVWVYQIVDAKGVEGWSSVDSRWAPWHEERPVITARVVTAEGVAHMLDPSTIVENGVSNGDDKIYSDAKVLRAPLPKLTPGAVVEERTVIREHRPFFKAGRSFRTYLTESVPVQRIVVEIDLPKKLPFQYKVILRDGLKPEITKTRGRIRYRFVLDDVEKDPKVEENVPKDIPVYAAVLFSTARSWKEVARSYADMVNEALKGARFPDDVMGQKDADPLVTAIRFSTWMEKRVRYTGLEIGQSAITPVSPAMLLQRGYGDCKDKSTMLVGLLRAAGFDADVALLKVQSRDDVHPDFPGLGRFNHAIVVIHGNPDVWFDPTVSLNRSGVLPADEQGRYALVASRKTRNLVRIPMVTPADNWMLDERTYHLKDTGYMDVSQISTYAGVDEPTHRMNFQNVKPDDLKKALAAYVQRIYRFGELVNWSKTESDDLSGPFQLRLEAKGVGRGITEERSAVVAVLQSEVLNALPELLRTRPKTAKKGANGRPAAGDAGETKEDKREHPYHVGVPFLSRLRVRVEIPDGFKPREIPEDETIDLGPFRYMKQYRMVSDRELEAELSLRFDGSDLLPDQIPVIREKALKILKKDAILMTFDHEGYRLLEAGSYRDAVGIFRDVAGRHPKSAVHALRLARAYLEIGLGTSARKAVDRAIALDPASADAYGLKGWILQHDELGRRFGHGYDRAGAIAAYRKAIELDPREWTYPADLAILLEYDETGRRYTTGDDMQESVRLYETVRKLEKGKLLGNVPFDLLYLGRYRDLEALADEFDDQDVADRYRLLARIGEKGLEEGLAFARTLRPMERRRGILSAAANQLVDLRKYAEAAALMREAARGAEKAMELESRADLVSGLTRFETRSLDMHRPEDVYRRYLIGLFRSGGFAFDAMKSLYEPSFFKREQDPESYDNLQQSYLRNFGGDDESVRREVLLDLAVSSLKYKIEEDGNGGVRLHISGIGFTKLDRDVFMARTETGYRMIGDTFDMDTVALRLLDYLEAGKVDAVGKWLDWITEIFPDRRASEKDELDSLPFHFFWNREHRDALSMKLAIATWFSDRELVPRAIRILESGIGKWDGDAGRPYLDAALCVAAAPLRDGEKIEAYGRDILRLRPDSSFGVLRVAIGLHTQGKTAEAVSFLKSHLDDTVDRESILHGYLMLGADTPGFDPMWKAFSLLDQENWLNANDYNTVAWACLFGAHPVEEGLSHARTAVKLSDGKSSYLHTLAALYAESGRCREARQALDACMEAVGKVVPDGNDWYVLARIAEQYGEKETAIRFYRRVCPPKETESRVLSTWELAHRRLQALGAGRAD